MKLNIKRPNALAEWSSRVIKLLGLFLVISIVWNVCQTRLNVLKQDRAASMAGYVSAEDRLKQLDCLTRNIYWEAASEPFEGKVAVAQVTMNRASHPSFPQDVCAVVYQKSVIMDRVICQFSWYCDTAHKARPVNQTAYNESMLVAKKVLLEGFRLDVMKEALYYHANYVNPQWNLEKIGTIGNHIFYRGKK